MTLVTGGGSGLGRACVERFVKLGSRVVLCDLPTSQGASIAEELGKECVFAPTDVRMRYFDYFKNLKLETQKKLL